MKKRILAALLAVSLLSGCANSNTPPENATPDTVRQTDPTDQISITEDATKPTEAELSLTPAQQNSMNMLNYLALTSVQIDDSKNNRVILEEIHRSLDNNINPGSIDDRTQKQINNLKSTLEQLLNVEIKSKRLQYLYNQDKAAAIRNAISKSLSGLSPADFINFETSSIDWKKFADVVTSTIIKSYSEYADAKRPLDRNYLLTGWELNDKERALLNDNRNSYFDYMTDTVQQYGWKTDKTAFGLQTLSQEAVEEFIQICDLTEPYQKVQLFESSEATYCKFINYWIELADCYYEIGEFEKCLECLDEYSHLNTSIFRQDFVLLPILPKAYHAVQQVYEGNEYIAAAESIATAIIKHSKNADWAMRYYAAQIYIELFAKTSNAEYLQMSYDLIKSNVADLASEQVSLKEDYMSKININDIAKFLKENTTEPASDKDINKQAKEYAKLKEDERKTELPPVYEPLVLNCDLLFALANHLDIDEAEKRSIYGILHPKGNPVFLTKPINDRYSFDDETSNYTMELTQNELIIPADLLSQNANVVVTVTMKSGAHTYEDWEVTEVERTGTSVDKFTVHLSSETIKKLKWAADTQITVEIHNGDYENPVIFNYKVSEYKDMFLISDKVEFVQVQKEE